MADEYSEITDKMGGFDPAFRGIVTPKNMEPHRNIRLSDASNLSLAIEYHEHGSPSSRQKMIEGNQWLIMANALNYRHQPVPLGKIIQQAGAGLVLAIDNFRASDGVAFSVCAGLQIRSAIEEFIRSQRELPALLRARPVKRHENNEHEAGDLADRAQIKPESDRRPGLRLPINSEDVPSGCPEDSDIMIQPRCRELAKNLDLAVKGLGPSLRGIVSRYFGLNKAKPEPLSLIAESLGVSDQQIKLRIHNALSSLRKDITGE